MAEEMLQKVGTGRRYEAPERVQRRGPSLSEEVTRTVVRQLGTRQGQALVRGILGGLFGRR
jgi:hypothetical protein